MTKTAKQYKKPSYPVNGALLEYLNKFDRISEVPIFYEDLLRFAGAVDVYDKNNEDTLWVRVYYSDSEREEIDFNLKKVYSLLHSDGNVEIIKFLNIDAIDYCTFGNSKPFRIKVRNILNDNYVHFYVKKADASRIYGLELEEILSPDKINFLVYENTLIEEHILGIPGDVFMKRNFSNCTESEKVQIAKEFVKFNERCLIRLLGDMRSYNYVIIPIHDFDQVVYKIRAIDFDQQSYEGNLKLYRPQFFVENYAMVDLVSKKLQDSSVEQYRNEERANVAKRIHGSYKRIRSLMRIMSRDKIAPKEHIDQLKRELYEYTHDIKLKNVRSMGALLIVVFEFVSRNYKNQHIAK